MSSPNVFEPEQVDRIYVKLMGFTHADSYTKECSHREREVEDIVSSYNAFLCHVKAALGVYSDAWNPHCFFIPHLLLVISGEEVVYAREFLGLGTSFPEIDEAKVERIDDAAHMDVAIGSSGSRRSYLE